MKLEESWFKPDWPEQITHGCFLLPPLQPVFLMFLRLSRGRDFTMMGGPLPIKTRDLWDAIERCSWTNKPQLEDWLVLLDDEYLRIADAAAQRR